MKLDRVESSHPLISKLKMAAFGLATRQRAPDVVRMLLYRPELFGRAFAEYIHTLLRGASEWTVGERELFAAWVSNANDCAFCTPSHRGVAARALGEELVDAVFADYETAPVSDAVRETLRMLDALIADPSAFGPKHIRPALAAGASPQGLEQVIHIAGAFCTMNALADALGFDVPSLAAFQRMTGALLRHGYQVT